jgi:hypothetical protein
MIAFTQTDRPEIHTTRRAHREAIETQRDLERLVWTAVLLQASYFSAMELELLERASAAFVAKNPAELDIVAALVQQQTLLHIRQIAELLAAAEILGRARILHEAGQEEFAELLDRVVPQDVIRRLRALPVATREEWERRIRANLGPAFTVAGIEQKQVLAALRDLIAHSLDAGLTPQQFDRAARDLLRNFQQTAGRLRTVWNTTVGQAVARGREEALEDPVIKRFLSWRLFDAQLDSRVRPNHAALDNGVAPAEWWAGPGRQFRPLLGFNCRCTLLGITEQRALAMIAAGQARDLRLGVPEGAGPDPGFFVGA